MPYSPPPPPPHLKLLTASTPCYVFQVLPVVRTVLGTLGASHHELIKSVLTFLVSLIVSGAAGPTLDLMRDWSKVADPSLLRHFVELVRDCCGTAGASAGCAGGYAKSGGALKAAQAVQQPVRRAICLLDLPAAMLAATAVK